MYGDSTPGYASPNAGDVAGGILGGVIGAIGGIYDTYQGNKTAKENTIRTINAQREAAELAYQRSVADWHRQNLYNSPQAQMERFKAAGLSPHLIYGQGSAGNASNIPEYHAPNYQYRYAAPTYGGAVASVLPTLMQVGSWMQSMRSSEIDNQLKLTNTQRASQMVDYLEQMNPKLLQERDNRLSLFPYQKEMTRFTAARAEHVLDELQTEYRFKYGDQLWSYLPKYSGTSGFTSDETSIGGTKRLEFLSKQSQLGQELSKQKLLEAQASWTDFGLTNPQAIMQLVLGGVMGMAGQKLRLSTHKPGAGKSMRERPRGLVRRRMGPNHPDR